jgi:hypothetical protein
MLASGVQINVYVTLRIDNSRDAFGANEIRRMRQTAKIELFEYHPRAPNKRV